MSSKVIQSPGFWAQQEVLLQDLKEQRKIICETRQFSKPFLLVVSSNSQRKQLQKLVAEEFSAFLNLRIMTLFAFCQEFLTFHKQEPIRTGPFHFVLAERFAKEEETLAFLGNFDRGYSLVGATVEDLLDSGFEPDHEGALLEAASASGDEALVKRLGGLLSVAAKTQQACREKNLERPAGLLSRVREILEQNPAALAEFCQALWFYGFVDITQVGLDMFLEILKNPGTRLYLSVAPAPEAEDSDEPDPGHRFRENFEESLAQLLPEVRGEWKGPEVAMPLLAQDLEQECEEVAQAIRLEMDEGTRPEDILVVSRSMAQDAPVLARVFEQRGIPFSGLVTPVGQTWISRQALRLNRVLTLGAQCRVEDWLCLWEQSEERHRLSLGIRVMGIVQLGRLAALAGQPLRDLPLPINGDDDEGEEPGRQNILQGQLLRKTAALAAAFLQVLPDSAQELSALGWYEKLHDLVKKGFGMGEPNELVEGLQGCLDRLARLGTTRLSFEEILALLGRDLSEIGRPALGGIGGGVQTLEVMQARGLVAKKLFVMGLNRKVFPRQGVEDPLLPDHFRRLLRPVLRGLVLKAEVAAEESYLFAELHASCPKIVVSCRLTDVGGAPSEPSGFLTRLRSCPDELEEAKTPASLLDRIDAATVALPFSQTSLGLALTEKNELTELFKEAAKIAAGKMGIGEKGFTEKLAEGRATVFRLMEKENAEEFGPWFGVLGKEVLGKELRKSATFLEAWTQCPWQAFLEKILGVMPPVEATLLPMISAQATGLAVHQALEQLTGPALIKHLEEYNSTISVREINKPDRELLEKELTSACSKTATELGIMGGPYVNYLYKLAWPILERLVELEWPEEDSQLMSLGPEIKGEVTVQADHPAVISFRADRVDLDEVGNFVLTDYKTGKAWYEQKKPDNRLKNWHEDTELGKKCQAGLYALSKEGAKGRVVFGSPKTAKEMAVVGIQHGEGVLVKFKEETLPEIVNAIGEGVFTPRLIGGKLKPGNCDYCRVQEACIVNHSGLSNDLIDELFPEEGAAGVAEKVFNALKLKNGQIELDAEGEGEE